MFQRIASKVKDKVKDSPFVAKIRTKAKAVGQTVENSKAFKTVKTTAQRLLDSTDLDERTVNRINRATNSVANVFRKEEDRQPATVVTRVNVFEKNTIIPDDSSSSSPMETLINQLATRATPKQLATALVQLYLRLKT